MTGELNTLSYLQDVLMAGVQQTWAVVTQNPDGTLAIAIDVGPGAANEIIQPLEGPKGASGQAQFPLIPMPDVYDSPADLPALGVLTNTVADIGKYWIIHTTNEQGFCTSVGAYIWFGTEYRFLPFGNEGPPGKYGVMKPYVSLIGSDKTSQLAVSDTAGTAADPYLVTVELSVPDGPPGRSCPVAKMLDVNISAPPLTGQFLTCTAETVTVDEETLNVWAPEDVGAILPQPYIVPASAFTASSGIIFEAEIAFNAVGSGANTLMNVTTMTWSHNALAGADVFVTSSCSGTAVPSGVTYGGVAMTLVGSSTANGGAVSLWHLANVAGGTKSVVATIPITASTYMSANSVSFLNVGSISSALTTNANNTLAFQAVSLGANDVILQAEGFAGVPVFPYGGLIASDNSADSGLKAGLLVNYAITPTDFGTLGATANGWNSIAVVLSPESATQTICTFSVPTQEFDWKPLVWGQIQMFEIGVFGDAADAFLIGVEVFLGSPDPSVGTLVARGFGNDASGTVTIMPHTSSPGSNASVAMNPWNSVGLVPAGHGGGAGTLYVNVVNDGLATIYDYTPSTAQLFVLACPATAQADLQQKVYGALTPKVTLTAQIAVDIVMNYFGKGHLVGSNVKWWPQTQQFKQNGTYTPPSWWVSGTDHIDIVALSDGGGGSTAGNGSSGGPGGAGVWSATTLGTLSSGSLTVTVGQGGAGSTTTANGNAGTGILVKDGGTTKLSVAGGAGGVFGGGGSLTGVGWNGPAPVASETYQSATYYGGAAATIASAPGGWPGGGGAGTNEIFTPGGNGAAGTVWIVARKG